MKLGARKGESYSLLLPCQAIYSRRLFFYKTRLRFDRASMFRNMGTHLDPKAVPVTRSGYHDSVLIFSHI